MFQEFSDDEEERRVKRAEKAKRKAEASEASEGDVAAVESDDSRQGKKLNPQFNMKFNDVNLHVHFFQMVRAGVDIGTSREEPRTTATHSFTDSRGGSIHGEVLHQSFVLKMSQIF